MSISSGFVSTPCPEPRYANARPERRCIVCDIIADIENAWGVAVKAKDASALDKILAQDWVGRYPFYILTKSGELEHVRRGDFNITSIATSDMKIRVFEDAAVVTGTDNEKGSYEGRDTSGRYL